MPEHVADQPDHAVNRAHLRALLDDLAKDSDYNNPPRILRRDLLIMFLYLDQQPRPKVRSLEMEDTLYEPSPLPQDNFSQEKRDSVMNEGEDEERNEEGSESESDKTSEVFDLLMRQAKSTMMKSGAKQDTRLRRVFEKVEKTAQEQTKKPGGKRPRGVVVTTPKQMESKSNTVWTDWFDIIVRVATKFPYYMGTMQPLGIRPDAYASRTKWLGRWVDAFVHYDAPFQRRFLPQRARNVIERDSPPPAAKIQYRVNKDDAANYLRRRGFLLSPSQDASTTQIGTLQGILALSQDASINRGKTFNDLPVELRVQIWQLLLTYPESGVQFQYNKSLLDKRPRIFTITRNLHDKISLNRFLEDKHEETHMVASDQVIPNFKRTRFPASNLCDVFAPKTIHKMFRDESKRVFYESNLFVFTSLWDAEVFLKEDPACTQQHLRRVALAYLPASEDSPRAVYKLLAACTDLREIRYYFCPREAKYHHLFSNSERRETFDILARHEKLEAIYCNGRWMGKPQQIASAYIAGALSREGSRCKTYCDGVLVTAPAPGLTS